MPISESEQLKFPPQIKTVTAPVMVDPESDLYVDNGKLMLARSDKDGGPVMLYDLASLKGKPGEPGEPGEPGKDGVGEKGADGSSVLSGRGAPTEGLGRPGDTYIDALTGDVYRKG